MDGDTTSWEGSDPSWEDDSIPNSTFLSASRIFEKEEESNAKGNPRGPYKKRMKKGGEKLRPPPPPRPRGRPKTAQGPDKKRQRDRETDQIRRRRQGGALHTLRRIVPGCVEGHDQVKWLLFYATLRYAGYI